MPQDDSNAQANPPMSAITRSAMAPLGTCASCGQPSLPSPSAATSPHVYALGRIEPRFPRQSIEKEFRQVIARAETKGLTDRQAQHKILSQPENRYLARQMCWVLTIEGLETYLLVPRDPSDLNLLVDSLRATPSAID